MFGHDRRNLDFTVFREKFRETFKPANGINWVNIKKKQLKNLEQWKKILTSLTWTMKHS